MLLAYVLTVYRKHAMVSTVPRRCLARVLTVYRVSTVPRRCFARVFTGSLPSSPVGIDRSTLLRCRRVDSLPGMSGGIDSSTPLLCARVDSLPGIDSSTPLLARVSTVYRSLHTVLTVPRCLAHVTSVYRSGKRVLSGLVFVASVVLSLTHMLIQDGRTSFHAHGALRGMATMVTVVLSLWHMVRLTKQGSSGNTT